MSLVSGTWTYICKARLWSGISHCVARVGVKNKQQAEEAKGVLGWRLSKDEVQALDQTSKVLQNNELGAPFEQW